MRRTSISLREKITENNNANTDEIGLIIDDAFVDIGYSDEFIEFERQNIYKTLFSSLKEEYDDALKYFNLLERVEVICCEKTRKLALYLCREELFHHTAIRTRIEEIFPALKQEKLYPLYESLIESVEELKEELEKHK